MGLDAKPFAVSYLLDLCSVFEMDFKHTLTDGLKWRAIDESVRKIAYQRHPQDLCKLPRSLIQKYKDFEYPHSI